MTFIAWILLGLGSGLFASRLMTHVGRVAAADLVLGAAGAVFSGVTFGLVSGLGLASITLLSAVASIMGAGIMLATYHAVTARRMDPQ